MPKIRPFKAVLPTRDKVHLVASRSYLTYNKRQLQAKLSENPYSFIHIINPEFNQRKTTTANSRARFEKVREKYQEFVQQGIFRATAEEGFYVYAQDHSDYGFMGIIAGVSMLDYQNNLIKKHEHTLTSRETVFKEYLEVCGFNAEPVLLFHRDEEKIASMLEKKSKERAEFDFSTTDQVRHRLWIFTDKEEIKFLQHAFAQMQHFYIADGHHRMASSSRLAMEQSGDEDAPIHYCLSYLIPESQLKIYEYNRLVKGLNGMSAKDFIARLSETFSVQPIKASLYLPTHLHAFSMYLEGNWYALEYVTEEQGTIEQLDSHILSEKILKPILDIQDIRTDKNISFLDGQMGPEGIKNVVDSGKATVGFGLYPITAAILKKVADQGEVMPPKSTWIEPKLRSGLTIYPFQ